MNPENYDPPSFEEVMREKEDTITALRAEVERLGRYTDNAQGQVAQHVKEINALRSQLSARDAEVRALRFALQDAVALLENADCSDGYCLCGNEVAMHTQSDNHAPVDNGDYQKDALLSTVKALLDPQGSPGEPGPGGDR